MITIFVRPFNPFEEEDWTTVSFDDGLEDRVASVVLSGLLQTRHEVMQEDASGELVPFEGAEQ